MFFSNHKARVRGKIVLVGKPASIPVNLNPPAKRHQRRTGTTTLWTKRASICFPDAFANSDACANAPRPLSNRQVARTARCVSERQWRAG